MEFTISNGLGGLMKGPSCIACAEPLTRDLKTGNYYCRVEGCGDGKLEGSDGIETTVDEHGNVTYRAGRKPS